MNALLLSTSFLRAITEFVYLIEAHHHLNPISISKRDGPWRIDDCVVMLVFEAHGILSRFGEVQLSLVLEVSFRDNMLIKIRTTEDYLLHIVIPIHGKDFDSDNTEDPHMCPDCTAITFKGVSINVESLSLEPPVRDTIHYSNIILALLFNPNLICQELVSFFHLILKMNYIRMKDFDDFKCRAFQLDARADAQLFVGTGTSDDGINQTGSGVAGHSSSRGFHQSCLKFTLGIWALLMSLSSNDCAYSLGSISSSICRFAGVNEIDGLSLMSVVVQG
nr:hypothetical protein [Tanacetum cinerariifolium]